MDGSVILRRLAVVLLLASACHFMPTEAGVREFVPDSALARQLAPIWTAVETCSGHTRALSEIRWFQIPGALSFLHNGKEVAGYYRPSDQIVMGENGYYLDAWVAHEIVRDPSHPHEFFVECARLVSPP